jgi:hypothetical protein
MNILLHYTSSLSILRRVYNDIFNFSKVFSNLYALTAICVLSRLYDPYILRGS